MRERQAGGVLVQTGRLKAGSREKDDLLPSVPGVREQLTVTLLAHLPELGTPDRMQIAALVGVALINRDGGNQVESVELV